MISYLDNFVSRLEEQSGAKAESGKGEACYFCV